MASPFGDDSDWLHLGLGFTAPRKEEEKEEEEEKYLATPHHLEGYDHEDVGLDLGLKIGSPKGNLMHHKDKALPFFHHGYLRNVPLPIPHSPSLSSPNSGLWFALRSSTNRVGGGALPQIPKAYIRVKDENMTVFMVKKYLVIKLGLSNEAEVEIWCMGERLVQSQSLKQVRDGVWLPKLVQFVNSSNSIFHQTPSSSSSSSSYSTTYLMSLHYGRTYPLLSPHI